MSRHVGRGLRPPPDRTGTTVTSRVANAFDNPLPFWLEPKRQQRTTIAETRGRSRTCRSHCPQGHVTPSTHAPQGAPRKASRRRGGAQAQTDAAARTAHSPRCPGPARRRTQSPAPATRTAQTSDPKTTGHATERPARPLRGPRHADTTGRAHTPSRPSPPGHGGQPARAPQTAPLA